MKLDLFPVAVTTPDGTHAKARVLIDGDRALLFAEERREVRFVTTAVVVEVEAQPRGAYRIATAAGEWSLTRASGCGCGSKLKRMGRTELLTLAGVGA